MDKRFQTREKGNRLVNKCAEIFEEKNKYIFKYVFRFLREGNLTYMHIALQLIRNI